MAAFAKAMIARSAPAFLVTIDTEGDNLWARAGEPTCRNLRYLPRFQRLCEDFGFTPVYLTDYRAASDPGFVKFAGELWRSGACEIGMHLHAWDTPPHRPLSDNDGVEHPYLVNFSPDLMREKVRAVTIRLRENFGRRPTSHRAGRWVIDERYVAILAEQGYRVDCSVTPGVPWRRQTSWDGVSRGADYRSFPRVAYEMDPTDIGRSGQSGIAQVPMTILRPRKTVRNLVATAFAPLTLRTGRFGRTASWLRPNGRNLEDMLRVLESPEVGAAGYAEFMLHSSELMPGGSPTFRDEQSIETLYDDLRRLFSTAARIGFVGSSLTAYAERVVFRNSGLAPER